MGDADVDILRIDVPHEQKGFIAMHCAASKKGSFADKIGVPKSKLAVILTRAEAGCENWRVK